MNHSPDGRTANEVDIVVGARRGADWALQRGFSLQDPLGPYSDLLSRASSTVEA